MIENMVDELLRVAPPAQGRVPPGEIDGCAAVAARAVASGLIHAGVRDRELLAVVARDAFQSVRYRLTQQIVSRLV